MDPNQTINQPLSQTGEIPTSPPVVMPPSINQPSPKAPKRNMGMFMLIILVFVLLSLGGITFFMSKTSETTQAPTPTVQASSPTPVENTTQYTNTPSPTVSANPDAEVKQLDTMMNSTTENDFSSTQLNGLE